MDKKPKKPYTFRLSHEHIDFLTKYAQDHSLSNTTEALEQILDTKDSPPARSSNSGASDSIQSDVAPGMPEETNPTKQALINKLKQEKEYEVEDLPIPPCPFCSKGYINRKLGVQMIYCASKKYKKPLELALSVCQKCWERKEYMKQKSGQENEEPPRVEAPNCLYRSRKYPGAGKDADAVHDFGEEGKQIYCMDGGLWKTVEACQRCFRNYKSGHPPRATPFEGERDELQRTSG
jgi:hypothetical protein